MLRSFQVALWSANKLPSCLNSPYPSDQYPYRMHRKQIKGTYLYNFKQGIISVSFRLAYRIAMPVFV